MGKMIDLIFEGVNFAKIILIISPNYREIATRIGNEVIEEVQDYIQKECTRMKKK